MPECEKKHVLVRLDGCNMVKRSVHHDSTGAYIKHAGKNVYLSDIRGKYRYLNKLLN